MNAQDSNFVWTIFVVDNSGRFPNFYPVGLFTTREKALEEMQLLPKDMNYQLLRFPINRLFAYYHKKTGKLIGMDDIYHEHVHFKDDIQ
ncbi:hypothetical protein [Paenibacillus thalictri]|uniref:Uncharacterized protein n=1 Tax=Paenibacillus thalictri TaxID=2527873 RepID=A0A4Q9DWZ6_9BACL|nr:hypothetical protein [Paenibacillus thalictri]TBL79751.1 hypothetical protein EYB31_09085 [Paenibacillus thalictri]